MIEATLDLRPTENICEFVIIFDFINSETDVSSSIITSRRK